ncbi:MAG TPA: TonB-dependent receptor [Xanthomonadales bacterium]|nr:TonB-dependent receptor [Xanthomonadales bacterium]
MNYQKISGTNLFPVKIKLMTLATSLAMLFGCSLLLAADDALEEVVVMAQKRAESMQDVPVAIDALSGEQLDKIGFRDIDDIAAVLPSLTVTSNLSPLNASFRIRRIGNEGNIPTFEPDTALIVDGAFRSRSGLALGELVDIQSVEVLKGPQGTLYGKNASAGVISISTQAPTSEFGAMGEIGVGSDDYFQLKGYLNGALTENINGRVSISSTDRDPLIENLLAEGGDSLGGKAVRLQLSSDITDNLSSRLIIGRMDRDMHTMLGDTWYSPTVIAVAGAMAAFGAGSPVTNNDPSDRIIEQVGTNDFDQESTDAILHFDYSMDGMTFKSISGFEDYDSYNTMYGVEQMPSNLLVFNDRQRGTTYTQEFRLLSDNDSRIEWLVGAFMYYNDFTRGDVNTPEFELQRDIPMLGNVVGTVLLGRPVPILFGTPGDKGDVLAQQETNSFGVFGTMGYNLNEAMKLDIGLRYSKDHKDGSVDQYTTTALGCIANNLACSLTPDASDFAADDSWDAVTGNITFSWFASENSMYYATYSRGFKAGGFSLQWGNFSAQARPFDEETVDNYEMGWKMDLLDSRARVNGAVFHTEYDNFQNATFVGLAFTVNNAEKVVVDGIELDTTVLLGEQFTAGINVAYIDAEYDKYTGGQCAYRRTPDNALGQCDLSGQNLPFAPELTGNLSLEWSRLWGAGEVYARADYSYAGEANYSSELDPRHDHDAYWVGNLRTGWSNENWNLSAWIKNLADEVYYVQKTASPIASRLDQGASFQAFTGTPRTYGVTATRYF